MEQELFCDNAFIRHPARCHVCHPVLKRSFNFTFDIIYTIDVITLCSSPLLPWKACKSWRSVFYIFSTSHVPMTMLFSDLMTIPLPQTLPWFFFLLLSCGEDRLFSTQSPTLFTYFSLCEVCSLALQSVAPPGLLTSLWEWQWPGLVVACFAAWTHFPHAGSRN